MNFVVLWLFAKVFSAKFGGVTSFCAAICEGFLPQKFPGMTSSRSRNLRNVFLILTVNCGNLTDPANGYSHCKIQTESHLQL